MRKLNWYKLAITVLTAVAAFAWAVVWDDTYGAYQRVHDPHWQLKFWISYTAFALVLIHIGDCARWLRKHPPSREILKGGRSKQS